LNSLVQDADDQDNVGASGRYSGFHNDFDDDDYTNDGGDSFPRSRVLPPPTVQTTCVYIFRTQAEGHVFIPSKPVVGIVGHFPISMPSKSQLEISLFLIG